MAKKTNAASAPAQVTPSQKMPFTAHIKKVIADACICYTIIVLLIAAIGTTMNSESAQYVIYPLDILALFPFALVVGCANRVLFAKKLQVWSRVLLHALLVLGAFTLYLVTIKNFDTSAIAKIAIVLVVVYVVIMATVLTFIAIKNKKEKENSDYENVYSSPESNDEK